MKKAVFLFLCFCSLQAQTNEKSSNLFDVYLKRATIASFYSKTYQNSFHELNLVNAYIDSAYVELSKISDTHPNKSIFFDQINALKNDYLASKSIASDNLNYIYPSFTSFVGLRNDFNTIDDPKELLFEELLENILFQSDPIVKGLIKDNNQYVLLDLRPYDDTLFSVGIDFLNANSNFYSINNYEVAKILGNTGFMRFKDGALLKNDWINLLKYYDTDKIYIFKPKFINTGINNLFYQGLSFEIVNETDLTPKFLRYFESFRIEKNQKFTYSIIITILFYFIVFVILFFDYIRKFNFYFNKDEFFSNGLIIFSVVISNFISLYLLRLISPDINAFFGEFYTKTWLFLTALTPFILSLLLSVLIHTKFSKNSSTDLISKTKLFYAALCSPLLLSGFFINFSKIKFDYNYFFHFLAAFVCFVFVSYTISKTVNKIQNQGKVHWSTVFLTVIVFILYLFSVLFIHLELITLFIPLILIIPFSLLVNLSFKRYGVESVSDSTDQLDSLSDPYQYVSSGMNINDLSKSLNNFISNSSDIAFVIKGARNIGKSRFIKEFIKSANPSKSDFFVGDFDEFKDGNIIMYEPFYQAFCLYPRGDFKLDKGFFKNRTATFEAFSKVASIATSGAPIDLGSIISIDDNNSLSVDEIANELLELLINYSLKSDKKIIIVLDDYQWVDDASQELLVNFTNKLIHRGKYSLNIKFILVISDFERSINDSNLLLNKSYLEFKLSIKERFQEHDLLGNSFELFLEEIFKEEGFNYLSKNEKCYFSSNLKTHLYNILNENNESFNPGMFFNYISALNSNGLLSNDKSSLRLIKEPDNSFKYEDSSQLLMQNKFKELNDLEKNIIESAAFIGYKFDATILSHIWKIDLIEIIQILEKIENMGLILDDIETDNVFYFTNKFFHKWLREGNKVNKYLNHSQRVIEFQKRIIQSILIKGDNYIRDLEIDILKSISNRCNFYKSVNEIRVHSLKFNLITAYKLAEKNKLNQSKEFLLNIVDEIQLISIENAEFLLKTLMIFSENHLSFNQLDVLTSINGESKCLIDILLDSLVKNSNENQRSKSIIITIRDIYNRNLNALKGKSIKDLKEIEKEQLKRVQSIENLKEFIISEDRLKADFYFSLIDDDSNYLPLFNFRKSAISMNNFELAFEIGIKLTRILNDEEHIDSMFLICVDLLNSLLDENITLTVENNSLSFKKIKKEIKNILSNTRIKFKKAKDISLVTNRFIEVYYIKKEYSYVLELSKLTEALNFRIGYEELLLSNWPFIGASCIFLDKIDKAESYYIKHFNLLIKKGSRKEDFMHPLDGILHCAKLKNDYSKFNELNDVLYENLLYISDKMKNNTFTESKINSNKTFNELLLNNKKRAKPKNKSDFEDYLELSKDIFKIIYLVSLADGDVDESEYHDLIESVNAINYSLGYKYRMTEKIIDDLINEMNKLDVNNHKNYFTEICEIISEKHDKNTLRSIYHFCLDVASADNEIVDSEKILLEIAKSYFVK